MSFSINFANNLIEKSQTGAAVAIIDPTIVLLDGEWVGINHNILWGNPMR
jgi:hypothetical protein